jgi:hypothetical protein
MKTRGFVLLITVSLIGPFLVAQTAAVDQRVDENQSISEVTPSTSDLPADPESLISNSTQASSTQQTETEYVPALDASGLIALNNTLKTQLLVGANFSNGWDSNPGEQQQSESTGTILLSPYIGFQISSNNTHAVLQYQPTIQSYPFGQYSSGTMNLASASVTGNVGERWHWNFNGAGSYGNDYIRQLAPSQTEAVGNVAGTSSNTTAYLPNAGKVTYANGEAELRYDKSERDTIDIQASNSYSKSSGLEENGGTSSALLNYHHLISPKLGLNAYTQTSYYYGSTNCTGWGGGLGITWKPIGHTTLDVSGGPQLMSSACSNQKGFAYSASYSSRLTSKSQIYATSSRQKVTSYVGPSLWIETFAAGYQRELGHATTLSADVGYVSTDSLQTVNSYRNTYFDGIYSRLVGHALAFSVCYRNYSGNIGSTNYTRNIALLSLSWTPRAGHIFQ